VGELLSRVGGPITSARNLRGLRACAVLERVGTAQAREVLARLASGDPTAQVTVRAKGALQRLGRRPAASP
jgi:hypothetical protein